MRKTALLSVVFLILTHPAVTAQEDGKLSWWEIPTEGGKRLDVVTLSPKDTPDGAFQEQQGQAGVTDCPANQKFVDICIESRMNIFNSASIPPDPNGAAGKNSLIAVVNSKIEGLGKDGTTIFGPTNLIEMFAPVSPNGAFDPKIIYDVHEDRFVVVTLGISATTANIVTESNIFVAVSQDGNPTTTSSEDWYFLKIPSLIANTWADYPGIAVDEEAIYITNNMVPVNRSIETIENSLLWIIDKSPFYTGGTADWNVYDFISEAGAGARAGTHMPAMVRNPTGIAPNVGTYLVMNIGELGLSDFNVNEYIQIIQINNPLTGPSFRQAAVRIGDIEFTDIRKVPNAPQPGVPERIETNDRRALGAVWVNGELWMVTTATIAKDGVLEASGYWLKFNADGVAFPPTIADQGFIDGEDIGLNTFTYYPSLDVNNNSVAAFGFSASSNRIFASAYATIRDDLIDPLGTVRSADLVKAGLDPYFITFGSDKKQNRWGDYTGMALDPTDDDCFWAFNQYAGDSNYFSPGNAQFGFWNTAWARLCYRRPTSAPSTKPSREPSRKPTKPPTKLPTKPPTKPPTKMPTKRPTKMPTKPPTKMPKKPPTKPPIKPTEMPTNVPPGKGKGYVPPGKGKGYDPSPGGYGSSRIKGPEGHAPPPGKGKEGYVPPPGKDKEGYVPPPPGNYYYPPGNYYYPPGKGKSYYIHYRYPPGKGKGYYVPPGNQGKRNLRARGGGLSFLNNQDQGDLKHGRKQD